MEVDLPERTDLDGLVYINPDEAGMIDAIIDDSASIGMQAEAELILDVAISPLCEVMDIDWKADIQGGYRAFIIGYPDDSDALSKWTIRLVVES